MTESRESAQLPAAFADAASPCVSVSHFSQELQLNTQNFDDGEDPAMRGVRLLENRLDKALTKHNEALAIHKTYVLIAKRLREERIGFNNQASRERDAPRRTVTVHRSSPSTLLLSLPEPF